MAFVHVGLLRLVLSLLVLLQASGVRPSSLEEDQLAVAATGYLLRTRDHTQRQAQGFAVDGPGVGLGPKPEESEDNHSEKKPEETPLEIPPDEPVWEPASVQWEEVADKLLSRETWNSIFLTNGTDKASLEHKVGELSKTGALRQVLFSEWNAKVLQKKDAIMSIQYLTVEHVPGKSLGFEADDLKSGLVTRITPDSTAEEQGVRLGFKATKLNGDPYGMEEFSELLRQGRSFTMTFTLPEASAASLVKDQKVEIQKDGNWKPGRVEIVEVNTEEVDYTPTKIVIVDEASGETTSFCANDENTFKEGGENVQACPQGYNPIASDSQCNDAESEKIRTGTFQNLGIFKDESGDESLPVGCWHVKYRNEPTGEAESSTIQETHEVVEWRSATYNNTPLQSSRTAKDGSKWHRNVWPVCRSQEACPYPLDALRSQVRSGRLAFGSASQEKDAITALVGELIQPVYRNTLLEALIQETAPPAESKQRFVYGSFNRYRKMEIQIGAPGNLAKDPRHAIEAIPEMVCCTCALAGRVPSDIYLEQEADARKTKCEAYLNLDGFQTCDYKFRQNATSAAPLEPERCVLGEERGRPKPEPDEETDEEATATNERAPPQWKKVVSKFVDLILRPPDMRTRALQKEVFKFDGSSDKTKKLVAKIMNPNILNAPLIQENVTPTAAAASEDAESTGSGSEEVATGSKAVVPDPATKTLSDLAGDIGDGTHERDIRKALADTLTDENHEELRRQLREGTVNEDVRKQFEILSYWKYLRRLGEVGDGQEFRPGQWFKMAEDSQAGGIDGAGQPVAKGSTDASIPVGGKYGHLVAEYATAPVPSWIALMYMSTEDKFVIVRKDDIMLQDQPAELGEQTPVTIKSVKASEYLSADQDNKKTALEESGESDHFQRWFVRKPNGKGWTIQVFDGKKTINGEPFLSNTRGLATLTASDDHSGDQRFHFEKKEAGWELKHLNAAESQANILDYAEEEGDDHITTRVVKFGKDEDRERELDFWSIPALPGLMWALQGKIEGINPTLEVNLQKEFKPDVQVLVDGNKGTITWAGASEEGQEQIKVRWDTGEMKDGVDIGGTESAPILTSHVHTSELIGKGRMVAVSAFATSSPTGLWYVLLDEKPAGVLPPDTRLIRLPLLGSGQTLVQVPGKFIKPVTEAEKPSYEFEVGDDVKLTGPVVVTLRSGSDEYPLGTSGNIVQQLGDEGGNFRVRVQKPGGDSTDPQFENIVVAPDMMAVDKDKANSGYTTKFKPKESFVITKESGSELGVLLHQDGEHRWYTRLFPRQQVDASDTAIKELLNDPGTEVVSNPFEALDEQNSAGLDQIQVRRPESWKIKTPEFGVDVDIMTDTSSGDPSENFQGMHGNLIEPKDEDTMTWKVHIPGLGDHYLPLRVMEPREVSGNESFAPGMEKQIMANTNRRDAGNLGKFVRLIGIEDDTGGKNVWYAETIHDSGSGRSIRYELIPQMDMVDVNKERELNGEELVGLIAKLHVKEAGQKYGIVTQYDTSTEPHKYVVKVASGEHEMAELRTPVLLTRDQFDYLPALSPEEREGKIETVEDEETTKTTREAKVLGKDDIHDYQILADGLDHGWHVVIGFDTKLVPSDWLHSMVHEVAWNTMLTDEEYRAITGHEKLALTRNQKLARILDQRRKGFNLVAKDGLAKLGLSPEEWEHFKKSDAATQHLTKEQEAIGGKMADVWDELDDAERTVRKRDMIMRHNLKSVKASMSDYGRKLAGKAKQLGQLEYKVFAMPCEATRKAEKQEEDRLGPMMAIHDAAIQHQHEVANYNTFAAVVAQKQLEGWSEVNHMSKDWSKKVREMRLMRELGIEEWPNFDDGDSVQIRAVQGDTNDPLVGYIGRLEEPKWTCAGLPKQAEKDKGGKDAAWIKEQCKSRNNILEEDDAQDHEFVANEVQEDSEKLCSPGAQNTSTQTTAGGAPDQGACECCSMEVEKDILGRKKRVSLKVRLHGVPGSDANGEKVVTVLMTDLTLPGKARVARKYENDSSGDALAKIAELREHLTARVTKLLTKKDKTPKDEEEVKHLQEQIMKVTRDRDELQKTLNQLTTEVNDATSEYHETLEDLL
jgi:hypothetical protein